MTQPPQAAAAATEDAASEDAATEDAAEAELRRLRTACAGLSTALHALARTRRQLAAQVSILATEAVEAGCRGELWITHEGKSNESKFHRVVRSSEITCGREWGELIREEEVLAGKSGGSAKKGASPTNTGSSTAATATAGAAAATAAGGSDSPSSPSEVKHKLCCVPGCTKKEQGKWYGKMCKRHWSEKNPKQKEPATEAGSMQPIASGDDGPRKDGKKLSSASPVPSPHGKKTDDAVPPAKTPATVEDGGAESGASKKETTTPSVVPKKDGENNKTDPPPPAAGEKRPASAAGVTDGPSSSATTSGDGHLPQKKRKVEIHVESTEAGTAPKAVPTKSADSTTTTSTSATTTAPAPAPAPAQAAQPAPSAANTTTKKDGIHQESDGKWSASVLHTDGQSYGLGTLFDTKEKATLALGAFRSTLANESRAAGGRISEAMVKQARVMAQHAILAKGRSSAQKK